MSAPAAVARRAALADYLELTKPRITLMVMLTTMVGFVMGSPARVHLSGLVAALVGTGLVAAGASTLNMLLERRTDALMLRTRNRPLPAGRVRPADVLAWGFALTAMGVLVLGFRAGTLATGVALVTWLSLPLLLYAAQAADVACRPWSARCRGRFPP